MILLSSLFIAVREDPSAKSLGGGREGTDWVQNLDFRTIESCLVFNQTQWVLAKKKIVGGQNLFCFQTVKASNEVAVCVLFTVRNICQAID